MNYPYSRPCGLLALPLSPATLPAWADDDCEAPTNRWQSREALWQIAAYQGWQIQRLKIDDGCYELRGTDIQGRSFKAKIDPETLKVMKLKPEHHQRERQGWMQATAWRRSVAAVEPAALHAHVRGPDMAGSEGRLLRHESQSVLP